MNRRAIAIDVVVALAAFAISALVLAGNRPIPGIRLHEPDALGYTLLAAYSASAALRRGYPLAAVAWLVGATIRSNRRSTSELEAKNRGLEHARDELARWAVTEERLRIARELHDVVAHSMSVVAVHRVGRRHPGPKSVISRTSGSWSAPRRRTRWPSCARRSGMTASWSSATGWACPPTRSMPAPS